LVSHRLRCSLRRLAVDQRFVIRGAE
jgi:hypothetical protein